MKKKSRKVICPYCNKESLLVTGKAIYPHRSDLFGKKFWQCAPCDAYVGTHRNSKIHAPLGRLADAALRTAKKNAHTAFDPRWMSGKMTRKEAYTWLAKCLKIDANKCHIGMFDVKTCNLVVALSQWEI